MCRQQAGERLYDAESGTAALLLEEFTLVQKQQEDARAQAHNLRMGLRNLVTAAVGVHGNGVMGMAAPLLQGQPAATRTAQMVPIQAADRTVTSLGAPVLLHDVNEGRRSVSGIVDSSESGDSRPAARQIRDGASQPGVHFSKEPPILHQVRPEGCTDACGCSRGIMMLALCCFCGATPGVFVPAGLLCVVCYSRAAMRCAVGRRSSCR
jgi:hypothetical protein